MGMKRRVLSIAACILAVFSIALLAACNTLNDLKTDVTIEVGSPISIDAFFENVPEGAEFLTDVSGINTAEPGVYQLKIRCGKKSADVILRIEDHTPPAGEAIPQTVYLNWKMPEAKDCIANLYDFSGIALVDYQDGGPGFTEGGEYQVPVVVADVYGHSAVIHIPFTVINDTTPPIISGLRELELEGNPDQLDYLEGVTATDDYDPEPILTFDDSKVDYTKTGTYELIYRASDKAGNIGTATTTIKIKVASETAKNKTSGGDNGTYYVGDGDPYALARKVMSGLWGKDDVATARNIFNWVHNNLWFRLLSGTRNYEHAAYRGFTKHSGDCYVYYSCCKMLLDIAGIENMRVDRYPKLNGKVHFWLLVKLNGEWYHCDATEGYNDHPGVWFMCTDAQINDRYHKFNGALYPPRAGGSKEFASPTPVPSEEPSVTPSPSVSPSVTPTVSVTPSATPTVQPSAGPTATPAADTPTPTPEGNSPAPTQASDPTPSATPVPVTPDTPTPTTKPTEATSSEPAGE